MNSTLTKVLTGLSFVLVGISVLLVILFYMKNASISSDADFKSQMESFGMSLEYYIIWTYLLLGVATAGAIIFPVLGMLTNPKGAVKTLISIAFFAVVVLIAYSLADDTVLKIPGYTGGDNIPSRLKFAGASIYAMYFFFVIAVASILVAEVSKIFK